MSAQPLHVYTALLDVLAYREHLERDRKEGSLAFQAKLAGALRVLESVNEVVFGVQAISDTIILTCRTHAQFLEFLILLRSVFVAFLNEHLFVRGGVAYSRHFQSKYLTYSHAIARAYEIESKAANYPRIVIDENIVRMYQSGSNLLNLTKSGYLCMQNGVYFLDVLTRDNWGSVRAAAEAMYVESADVFNRNESAFVKHVMFERYLMHSPHAPADAVGYTQRVMQA